MDTVIIKATDWFNDHKKHVTQLSQVSKTSIKPTGSDLYNPTLWKGCHWNWFLIQTNIQLTEKKKWWQVLFNI